MLLRGFSVERFLGMSMNLLRAAPALLFALTFAANPVRGGSPSLAELTQDDLNFAAAQYRYLLASLEGRADLPRTWQKGELKTERTENWTCGFFPGTLWYLYEATGDPEWRAAAERFTALVEPAKDNRHTHDVGFMLNCSFGNGLRLTGNAHYREVLLTGAASLSTRFNPVVGAIRSWDKRPWQYPVIIDNLMNLELLLWVAEASGTPRYRDIAIAHADTTLRHQFRPDGGTFHVVDYDPDSGAVLSRTTHQGAADDSTWARGEAWALYGYTMLSRETRRPAFLAQAEKIAAFMMHHPRMPADKVPYWDFDAPQIPNTPRDASAAAIMCSALLELSTLVPPEAAAPYRTFAADQLRSLSSPAYRAPLGSHGGFLLLHSTANFPQHTEVDVPMIYADYYWLEALLRARRLR